MRSLRTAASELRQHHNAWARLVTAQNPRATNYGDELSRLIVERATSLSFRWSRVERADLVAIGSILDLYQSRGGHGAIWGSGIANSAIAYDSARIGPRVISVRGPLTRDLLRLAPGTPLGDPGLLAREFLPHEERKTALRVLVPHYSAFASAEGRAAIGALRRDGYTVAPPNLKPREMTELVARAQSVASSGLHGVILAHAYGTPSTLISFARNPPELPGFKYQDFFASIGLTPQVRPWGSILSSSSAVSAELQRANEQRDAARENVQLLMKSLERSSARLLA